MLKQRGFTLTELLIGLAAIAWLAAIVGVIAVAWHFISKFW